MSVRPTSGHLLGIVGEPRSIGVHGTKLANKTNVNPSPAWEWGGRKNRRQSEHCSRSNSPFLNPTPADLDGRCSNSSSSKPTGILRTGQDKMSPLSMPSGPSATSTTAAAAAAAVAAAQVHLNGTSEYISNTIMRPLNSTERRLN
uniref:Uncharacterized protein n=1 Tax=Anopheles epiroticus TaxID=199890 RepID=A0A182P6J7_9DIPT